MRQCSPKQDKGYKCCLLSYGRDRLNPTETQNSQTAITLVEYGSIEIALRADVYAVLRSRYTKQIEIAHTGREGVYKLIARDYVGRISLPGGGLVVIRPKVGVGNLFYMLCADAGLADFHPPPTG